MQANPRSLDALFNSQLRYVVPMFQRLYVWQENPQWATLWEDVAEKAILQLRGVKTNPHYLGALIIEGVRPSSPREVKRFLVIDGQQRLTTLQLLLCAYRDIARRNEWKMLERPSERYLENADPDVMEHPEEELFKIWPTTLNRDVFQSIVKAGSRQAVEARHPLVRLPKKRKPEPRSLLVEAYLYFSQSIDAWIASTAEAEGKSPEASAFALLQALQQDFSVVEIALSEGDDSQEIFYSLNSQGRPLSQSDLLRSLVFMRAEKEQANRDEIFKNYWSKFETPFWSSEVKRGGRSYSRLDLGLRYFLMAKTGQMVDARRVNEEYRRWVSATPPRYASVKDELSDFVTHGDVYTRYESLPMERLPSADLRRVLADFDVSTALPLIMFLELEAGLDAGQLAESLGTLESFIARRVFLGEENKEYNKLFVDVIASLNGTRGAAVPSALRRKLLEGGGSTRRWPTDDQVLETAIGKPVFESLKTPALRLILERLELSLRGKKTERGEIDTGLQIEHVLPQAWATHWQLKGREIPANIAKYPSLAKDDLVEFADSIRQRNVALHTLGNLTLLNKYLNPAASNGSFELKLFEYRNSVLRLNRHFDGASEWDEQAIAERGKTLGEALCEIWPRPLLPVN
ncbi:DUF262 domain-containing protein [Acidovorax sp. SUPP3334]|uniref:DUF262 domain-containing protein n=1 Tax=Acidovorax sp. SUPP3334 TaxID=2920881 RepID=UPI0023DE3565|nr:DUF262 domain-containing protein [Acidovorax sp. SUPP3334]GKT24020.1 DUF262 domain-containing HNH endonuclease family protein [Acidovorax sp. SUPP3334]